MVSSLFEPTARKNCLRNTFSFVGELSLSIPDAEETAPKAIKQPLNACPLPYRRIAHGHYRYHRVHAKQTTETTGERNKNPARS